MNFFEWTLEATVDNYFLKTKTDFMIASGSVGIFKLHYFHFQVYEPLNPSPFGGIRRRLGDSMGQLFEAFLVAQHQNKTGKPIYGCEVIGATKRFKQRLDFFTKQIKEVELQLQAEVTKDTKLEAKKNHLISIPGVGFNHRAMPACPNECL